MSPGGDGHSDTTGRRYSRRGLCRRTAVLANTAALGHTVHAQDALNPGDEQWRFETGAAVLSPPTVVDGTVYVGSYDGNVYALNVGRGASSEGSWARLGTLGRHDNWCYAEETTNTYISTPTNTQTDWLDRITH